MDCLSQPISKMLLEPDVVMFESHLHGQRQNFNFGTRFTTPYLSHHRRKCICFTAWLNLMRRYQNRSSSICSLMAGGSELCHVKVSAHHHPYPHSIPSISISISVSVLIQISIIATFCNRHLFSAELNVLLDIWSKHESSLAAAPPPAPHRKLPLHRTSENRPHPHPHPHPKSPAPRHPRALSHHHHHHHPRGKSAKPHQPEPMRPVQSSLISAEPSPSPSTSKSVKSVPVSAGPRSTSVPLPPPASVEGSRGDVDGRGSSIASKRNDKSWGDQMGKRNDANIWATPTSSWPSSPAPSRTPSPMKAAPPV